MLSRNFDWDESRSESEIEGGMINHFAEADKLQVPIVSDWKCYNSFSLVEELWSNVREESTRLQDELTNTECEKELEGRIQAEISKNESLMIQLGEFEATIESLQAEVETLSQSKRIVEDQFEISKTVKEDHKIQLTTAKVELAEGGENLSFLGDKLDNKNTSCEVLEATCLDLQLQLESMTNKVILKYDLEKEEKPLQNESEITAASEKLAECQETILNLGRQFQAMASPRDASLFNKVIPSPTDAITTMNNNTKMDNKKRPSLLDKMMAEDNAEIRCSRSPKTKEIICPSKSPSGVDGTCSAFSLDCIVNSPEGIKHENGEDVINSLDNATGKRNCRGGLLKKLFWRSKKGNYNNVVSV